jgi:DNA-binding response OmpR family regulator
MIRNLLEHALSSVDFQVETADNAKGGMTKFDSERYDLVITDVQMPGVDGHYVVNHIRCSDRQKTPVIGVSGTPWLLNDGGFDDVLHKPFAIQSLIEKAKSLVYQL